MYTKIIDYPFQSSNVIQSLKLLDHFHIGIVGNRYIADVFCHHPSFPNVMTARIVTPPSPQAICGGAIFSLVHLF